MKSVPVLKGTLDLLVLKALSWTPMHGFELRRWFDEHAASALAVEDSAIYQSLYRMEHRGLVRAEWGVTNEGRRARYYSVTAAGRAHLRAETMQWTHYADIVGALLTLAPQRR
ncbi:MAG TPA: PadR family transcriptional regulator [Acidimicrobiia bacterium]|nr:PadR family transcriptional regulator [Acidimicrobiia bacterium]